MNDLGMYSGAEAAPQVDARERSEFLRKTYTHLGLAILAFVALTAVLINSSLGPKLTQLMWGNRFGWLLVLGLFMGVAWVADRWAHSRNSVGMQYLGLCLYVVAEAIIFVPILYVASTVSDASVIPTAGLLTLLMFGGLTATVVITGKDFSFLGKFLVIGGFGAMGLIVVAIVFGLNLGTWFSFAMVLLASATILFQTSKIMRDYPPGSHVAASLGLFASVALMFWYVLQLVMSFTNR